MHFRRSNGNLKLLYMDGSKVDSHGRERSESVD